MTYAYIFVFLALAAVVLALLRTISDRADKRRDEAETASLKAMTPEQRSTALIAAISERDNAYWHFVQTRRLWLDYRWGYKHNPHTIAYTIARMDYNWTQERVTKLQAMISAVDGNASKLAWSRLRGS